MLTPPSMLPHMSAAPLEPYQRKTVCAVQFNNGPVFIKRNATGLPSPQYLSYSDARMNAEMLGAMASTAWQVYVA